MPVRIHLFGALLSASLVLTVGCGSGSNPGGSAPLVSGPAITMQPQNGSVPMGLAAEFRVEATGSALNYQWYRNGSILAGATAATYTTQPLAFSDSGVSFTVKVSNAGGAVTSSAALLTVTARAPKAGDLRFQQVDAPTTINGYQRSGGQDRPQPCLVGLQGGVVQSATAETGTAFFLGNDPCSMKYATFALPSGVTGAAVVYASQPIASYPAVLGDASYWTTVPSPYDPGSMIQSLRLTATTAGLSWAHSDGASGFSPVSASVRASTLQAVATQEGEHGRVITALSYDGKVATYFSYGWSGDPSTLYESKVAFASLSTAAAAIMSLANDGYILTAAGGTQAADGSGVILIGTRVQGDSMPRPVSLGTYTASSDTTAAVMNQGYAIVAVVQQYDTAGTLTSYQIVGER